MVESEYSIILRLITLVFTSHAYCQSIVERGIQTMEVAERLVWFFAKEREAILATHEVGQLIEQVCMCGLILD